MSQTVEEAKNGRIQQQDQMADKTDLTASETVSTSN